MERNGIYLTASDEAIYERLLDNELFADLFNGSFFQGNQVIDAKNLEDSNEKKQIKVSGREVHYGMPVRNMMYDAIDYMKQMQQLEKENRENKELKGKAEFLSGLKREDRLLPAFTMVFYYGERQMWDGPMCLHDMLKFPAVLEPWKEYLPDYPLNLVYSHNVQPENFRTGLREVFELLRVANDKKVMGKFLLENKKKYENLDWEKGELISDFLNIPLIKAQKNSAKKGGKFDMCTAFRQMYEEGESKGEITGESKVTKLMQTLFSENKMDEAKKAVFDDTYRKELYKKYHID